MYIPSLTSIRIRICLSSLILSSHFPPSPFFALGSLCLASFATLPFAFVSSFVFSSCSLWETLQVATSEADLSLDLICTDSDHHINQALEAETYIPWRNRFARVRYTIHSIIVSVFKPCQGLEVWEIQSGTVSRFVVFVKIWEVGTFEFKNSNSPVHTRQSEGEVAAGPCNGLHRRKHLFSKIQKKRIQYLKSESGRRDSVSRLYLRLGLHRHMFWRSLSLSLYI